MNLSLTRKAVGLLVLVSLSGCASAIKKQCDETNWFQYGEEVAKRGERTVSDPFVQRCEKAESLVDHASMSQGFRKGLDEYCTPEFAYLLGKRGAFLVNDMCAGFRQEKDMKVRHAEGVREYCQPSLGVAAGATGKPYNKICPKELEGAFLPEFKKGRKKYIELTISQREAEIGDLDREVSDLHNKKFGIQSEIARLDHEKTLTRKMVYDPATNTHREEVSAQTNQQAESQISSLRWDESKVDQEIGSRRGKQGALREEIRKLQGELITLE